MKLTPDQINEYTTRGVLVARQTLTDADLQPVIDEVSALIDHNARQLHADGKIEELHEDAPFETRYGLLFKQCPDVGKGLDIMHYRGQASFDLLHNKNLLDAVEGLVGAEITCSPIQHLRAKPPAPYEQRTGPSFHQVPWHQDAGVMMPEAEDSNVVTCWFPLGDSTIEMGCLEVLPGVVEGGYRRHQKEGGTTIKSQEMPEVDPEPLECCRGDVIFLSRFTPHRSTPNLSGRCRWSMDLRYQTTGHHTGRTGHPAFVVRSTAHPASVMDQYDEWCRLWIDAFENPQGVVTHRGE
jgi:phytanoyl-CoA hydroxylase